MEISDNAKYWLRKLGNFGVTGSGKEIKGWALLDDCDEYERVYFSAEDLRKLASAANEVADKLDGGLTPHAPDKSGDSVTQAKPVKSSNPPIESAPFQPLLPVM